MTNFFSSPFEFVRVERLRKTSVTCYVSIETNDSQAAIYEIHTRDETTDVVSYECVWCRFLNVY